MKNSKISLFVAGIGTILESTLFALSPQLPMKKNYYKNDSEALKHDWLMVGKSIERGINEYETSKEYSSRKK